MEENKTKDRLSRTKMLLEYAKYVRSLTENIEEDKKEEETPKMN